MKREEKMYNVLFPLWMLMLFPQVWLIILPGNFIIDSIVLIISMFALHIADKKKFYIRTIFKIFGIGILSDIIGSAYMLLMTAYFEIGIMGDEPYLTIPALVISAVCIYFLNYLISFRKCEKNIRIRLSLVFAIATAPYTFLVPSSWLYY